MQYHWYVVQVLSGQEKKAQRSILEQRHEQGMTECVEEVIVPTENVSEVKAGERRVVEKRIWPGYLLVRMALGDESWHYIKNCNGVINFLGGSQPNPLGDAEVEEILSDLKDKETTVTQKHLFEVGDRVKINDGVFINFIGEVTDVMQEKGRLNVLVSIFGRDTQVDDLEFWQVEKVTDD